MSHFFDRLTYFTRNAESFADGHGEVTPENREWEDSYRGRWQHDKIVRSTHGVNCTGSCSWKIYVKGGIVTWETQQTDYPRTRPGLPNHEPRGCARGASYSWYLYSANRLKHPLMRSALLSSWEEKRLHMAPVEAWQSLAEDETLMKKIRRTRGMGGFRRVSWQTANDIIAAANIYTAKKYGPDRIVGFSPIPAMSMVSYAAGSRYLSLIGGVCLSFYDWYCDLPPASPQTWGEQTDVPESADWFNSGYIVMWGSNVPQTRTPDAHFMTEVRYRGTKVVSVFPDYSEGAKFGDIWLKPKQGTDAALAMAMGHVILKEFLVDRPVPYFVSYLKQYSDMAHLVRINEGDHGFVADRFLRASDLADNLGEKENAEWKTLVLDETANNLSVPHGSMGFRWTKQAEEAGRWNLEMKASDGTAINPRLSLCSVADAVVEVALPYFANREHPHFTHSGTAKDSVLKRRIPVKKINLADGSVANVATVYDLMLAQYGVDQGLGGDGVAHSFDDDKPYTPAWQERITGVPRAQVIRVAREFADNAEKTQGQSMVIIGASMNHWFHMDMNYRSIINLLVFCGCIGQSGGGWAHYVGQEKLRPQTGWLPLAFATDWHRPPRQMNSTSFFYSHTDQWRYETLSVGGLLSPTLNEATRNAYGGSLIDYNVRAERMGWLPSAPQLMQNPLSLAIKAKALGQDTVPYVVESLKQGSLKFSCVDPDHPQNFPRNMFIWRSNLLGSSGKGHEYFLKHLLGTKHGVQGKDLGVTGITGKPTEVVWHDDAPEGKLDLLVTLDFRMSTTCLYSDIVLPTATWYEKNDLNTSDMHPFIHPLSAAVDPAWEARSDWDIYQGIAKRFSELSVGHLGVEQDVVMVPILHDTPGEMAQAIDVKEWHKGECTMVPNKTMPNIVVVERDYPATYEKFTSLGPLLAKLGNGGKGIGWNTEAEVHNLVALNGEINGRARIDSDIAAAETLLMLAPETNGEVAVKAWAALSKMTGIDHTHLALPREHEKIRFRDVQAQPRKIISSPTWSGLESDHVSYNAGYTNVHECIPWRTLTGRQQLYQDHPWMLAFGEGLVSYKPPVDMQSHQALMGTRSNGHPELVLNFITPHQKWGIHSTYTDNLLMLTLSRGGPIVWLSEIDAKQAGIEDNDWIEAFNQNGALTARAVVSQRVPTGMVMMYHAQEKIINVPGSEITGTRGGIHNSVTRAVVKPTHMIGGYAQQSYGFNYYGTVGSNRDEFVIVRKMNQVDWLES